MEPQWSNCVYILQSCCPYHPNRTYVGFTTNVNRRLRQHNGEIKGGAKYTRVGRPYKIACVISGFESKSAALSFEWHMHHPLGRPGRRGRVKGRVGIEGRRTTLDEVFAKKGTDKISVEWF